MKRKEEKLDKGLSESLQRAKAEQNSKLRRFRKEMSSSTELSEKKMLEAREIHIRQKEYNEKMKVWIRKTKHYL